MCKKTQAEIFIQTLEEMRNHELERKKARLRLKIEAHVERFMQEFRTLPDSNRHRTTWIPQDRQTAQETKRQILDE